MNIKMKLALFKSADFIAWFSVFFVSPAFRQPARKNKQTHVLLLGRMCMQGSAGGSRSSNQQDRMGGRTRWGKRAHYTERQAREASN